MGRCSEEGCSGARGVEGVEREGSGYGVYWREGVLERGCIGEGVYWRGGVVERCSGEGV